MPLSMKNENESLSINTLTAMSTNIVDMAVFNEAVSTMFVDGYLFVSSAGNNCYICPMLFL